MTMCVMSDPGRPGFCVVTAAVNPSDTLGGMNTCDRHRARVRVGKLHNMHARRPLPEIVLLTSLIPFSQVIL